MTATRLNRIGATVRGTLTAAVAALALSGTAWAATPNITVVGSDGATITNYRWVIEQDETFNVTPGVFRTNPLAINFVRSHMRVHASGRRPTNALPNLTNSLRYFISVLPDSGYALGGARIPADNPTTGANEQSAPITIRVVKNDAPGIPTARISIFAFEDNNPTNNAPDLPAEKGLPGFFVQIVDAGGIYGQAGGPISQDAFGNPLGTTYNPDGSVDMPGSGIIVTDAQGFALVENLSPGKYGVNLVAPTTDPTTGEPVTWQQVTTIEGGPTTDAWVKPREPRLFIEFGPPAVHVFVGFVKPTNLLPTSGGATISGTAVNLHMSRPPEAVFYNGPSATYSNCWVALNDLATGAGGAVFIGPCDGAGGFSIPNVPAGNYRLVLWDEFLQTIIGLHAVTVIDEFSCATLSGGCELFDIPMFQWFSRTEHYVFTDLNGNGFPDADETPYQQEVPINFRFRDGTVYQSFPTDIEGFVPFDQLFPFFHWLVAEVDYTRDEATGVTVVVDGGGPIDADAGWDYPSFGILNPQPQYIRSSTSTSTLPSYTADPNPNTGNTLSRTETGPVLLEGFQGMLGQTSVFYWGKRPYEPDPLTGVTPNGGISGIVHYSTTRAENDPKFGTAEQWEPGIPRVRVNLYRDFDRDGIIDSVNGTPGVQLFVSPSNTGDAIASVLTDSWDDSRPTGCQPRLNAAGNPVIYQYYSDGPYPDCFDGWQNFNQVRPAVFDGGYAFFDVMFNKSTPPLAAGTPLAAGAYIVEVVPPAGYQIVKEEDKNVDFGDPLFPALSALAAPVPAALPECVGAAHTVPAALALFPGVPVVVDPGMVDINLSAPGLQRPLCDRKLVQLDEGRNAGANFFLFTEAPIAAHFSGFVSNDLAQESNPSSPIFGEKASVQFIPIAIREFDGTELARVYTDQEGRYNGLLHSTYSANALLPSGMVPHMALVCVNDGGPIQNLATATTTDTMIDPNFNPKFSQSCFTQMFMPGTTTFLDTPVLPIAAFANDGQPNLDCEFPPGTPRIFSVTNLTQQGPIVRVQPGAGETSPAARTLQIRSMETVQVPNPAFVFNPATIAGSSLTPATVPRDYGFGNASGSVQLLNPATNAVVSNVSISAWSNALVTATVPDVVAPGAYQLRVTRPGANGLSSVIGVTVTVLANADATPITVVSPSNVPGATPIQNAIDFALPGSIVTVRPGRYPEAVIMWKPIRLQGFGEGTIIDGTQHPAEKIEAWRVKGLSIIGNVATSPYLLPGQIDRGFFIGPDGFFESLLGLSDTPGILVLAPNSGVNVYVQNPNARIDGFSIGRSAGGGIFANGFAKFLQISNNRMFNNQGFGGGGILLGHDNDRVGDVPEDAQNYDIVIRQNHIAQNGALSGAGGGVSINAGADRYQVIRNNICGNFANANGGGIGHFGLSTDGLIANNRITFNQAFRGQNDASGGGVFIGGQPLPGGVITPGSGPVTVNANLIQGNFAVTDGGGIALSQVNGSDVAASDPPTHRVNVYNNIIVNNVAGLAAGGISLQDAVNVEIIHNTIANNDSVAIAGSAFLNDPNFSTDQPAGIVSRGHSAALLGVLTGGPDYANPTLRNNIVWHNRSFHVELNTAVDPTAFTLAPCVPSLLTPCVSLSIGTSYWDLAVIGSAVSGAQFDPQFSVLTSTTGYNANNFQPSVGALLFEIEYFNHGTNVAINNPVNVAPAMTILPAFDEGGNFIELFFGPHTLVDFTLPINVGGLNSNYHLLITSVARARGTPAALTGRPLLAFDFDGIGRPIASGNTPGLNDNNPDAGADERN